MNYRVSVGSMHQFESIMLSQCIKKGLNNFIVVEEEQIDSLIRRLKKHQKILKAARKINASL